MSSRALQRLHFLVKASRFLDPRGRATVYKGFVRPTLEYCSLVWMGAPCHILDRVQKRALKIIGPGLWLPSLHHRRMVAAQTVLFKLWYLPVDHPLKSLLLRWFAQQISGPPASLLDAHIPTSSIVVYK